MSSQNIVQEFATGTLQLKVYRAEMPPEELFGFAERENPKRAFLFVSKVLGRHIPVAPSVMRSIWRLLAARIETMPGRLTLFVGMAETAIGLAAGVFRECRKTRDALFLADTRHVFAAPVLSTFTEDHSHAVRHTLYQPKDIDLRKQPVHLVAIDDEMTTGQTFQHLRHALAAAGLDIARFTRAVITDWSNEADTRTSLLKGAWDWQWRQPPSPPAQRQYPKASDVKISARQDWGRLGARSLDLAPWPEIHVSPSSRVLVLGSGEFVWPPFLLAERLEEEGAQVRYAATTRSPIKTGMAIRSKVEFADNYGLGIPNYLYNVHPDDFDAIFLCVETGREAVSPLLLNALRKAVVLEY